MSNTETRTDEVKKVPMPVQTRAIRRAANVPPHLSDRVELDSELNLPHAPLSTHLADQQAKQKKEGDSEAQVRLPKSDLKGDHSNVALLTFLYVLQGIPLGLAGSIPYLLQARKVSYKEQAIFSFVYWPFSVKLLWAPLVDSMFIPRFGRRKTWLIPTQYLIGIFMLVLAGTVPDLLGEGHKNTSGGVSVYTLTFVFFCLNFLAATQDIAVDGWALTMLHRRNVGWASTCNTVGQTAGYFLGNVVFLAFESPDFCNKYLRFEPQKEGMVTLAGFLYFWGIVFLITTTLVMVLKKEKKEREAPESQTWDAVKGTYAQLRQIVFLPAVLSLIVICMTSKIGFAAADAVTGLKLIEEGVPKESLALLGVPMVPIQIMLPIIISKYTAGPKPMDIFVKAYPFRLLFGLVFMFIVWWAPATKAFDGSYPFYFYLILLLVYAGHQVAVFSMFVAQMGFYARISDPNIGGTYMTLLNTVTNLGGNWPSTVALWMVDNWTFTSCVGAIGRCDTPEQGHACEVAGGRCVSHVDGYYVESIICIVIGLIWLRSRKNRILELQDLSAQSWKVGHQEDVVYLY